MKISIMAILLTALSITIFSSTSAAQQQPPGNLFSPQLGPPVQPGAGQPGAGQGQGPELNQFGPREVEPRNNDLQNRTPRNGNALQDSNGFDQSDPTQAPPDMRRILEGEQEQVRREPPPAIEVVGKVIGADGVGKALLRINERFVIVEKGTRFTIATGIEPLVFTVSLIDTKGVEIQGGGEANQTRLFP